MKLRHMAVKPSNKHNQPEAACAGNDSPQIPPPTGAPAIVVPMGFTNGTSHQPLPTSLQARARSKTTCMRRKCKALVLPTAHGSWTQHYSAHWKFLAAACCGPACNPPWPCSLRHEHHNFHHSFTQARHDQP